MLLSMYKTISEIGAAIGDGAEVEVSVKDDILTLHARWWGVPAANTFNYVKNFPLKQIVHTDNRTLIDHYIVSCKYAYLNRR